MAVAAREEMDKCTLYFAGARVEVIQKRAVVKIGKVL
jgi:hypothetical protein